MMTDSNKKSIILAGMIFGLAFVIFATQFILANLPEKPFDPLALTPERRGQLLARCRELKDKLRPWAEKHKSELQSMLKAQTSEIQKRDAVWNIAPSVPAIRNGKEIADGTDIAWGEFHKPVSFIFLCGSDRDEGKVDESAMAGNEQYWKDKQMARRTLQRRKNFYWSRFRDMPWIETIIPGREHFILWISGRITSHTLPADWGDRMMRERPETMEALADIKEFGPPYDFVR